MRKNSISKSGAFTPRLLVALALCSCALLFGMFSLAASPPVGATRAMNTLPTDPFGSIGTTGAGASQLPPGVPAPPNARFSANGKGDGFGGSTPAGIPRWLEPANRANSLGRQRQPNEPAGPATQSSLPANETAPTPASPVWSIVDSPNNLTLVDNTLSGISCVSASDCWAVGAHAGEPNGTLIEHWDGSSWTIVESPNAANASYLTSVACISASACWAVGIYDGAGAHRGTLIERWDGSSWTIVQSPDATATKINILSNVTCASASDCWAVGRYFNDNWIVQTLVEHWDGNSWSLVTSENVSTTQDSVLYAVTCTSGSNCWAVGYYNDSGNKALIERWDGTSWKIDTSTSNLPASSTLSAIACTSSSQCWAVGFSGDGFTIAKTLIAQWNGASWSVVPAAAGSANNFLNSVTCVSASECWAVGVQASSATAGYQTLVERWNGTFWSIVAAPNPSSIAIVASVTCTSSTACWLAGSYYAGHNADHTFAERWDGTSWAIIPTANVPPTATNNLMWGVSCPSASDCWAVGYYLSGVFFQTLIEHWDGASWTIVDSPNVNEINNVLYSVSCVSSSDCWALGHYFSPSNSVDNEGSFQTLIEHWDGTSWTIVDSPNYGVGFNNGLESVTCVSTSDCWGVGYYYANVPGSHGEGGPVTLQTLIEHWDGNAWTIAPSPNTSPSEFNFLFGVTCASASQCWAVGSRYNDIKDQTLIERWDGTSWTIVSSPNTSATADNDLSSVACPAAGQCWAVGSYFDDASHVYQTLIERWDGTSWSIASSPNASNPHHNLLLTIACASDSQCWAVGIYIDRISRTLVERWDGTSWTLASSPNTDPADPNYLYGATCTSQCWAVGVYINADGIGQTLMELLSLPAQLNSVVSSKIHGNAGTYDVDLTSGATECRSGGTNGDYTLVFTFANPLTSVGGATVSSGTAGIKSRVIGSDAHQYIVDLTGVTNAQRVVISLNNVQDVAANFSGNVAATFNLLVGDTTADGFANSTDIAQTKSQSGTMVINSNYREDLNADGSINSTDIALAKSKSGSALP
jgi:hypothetical protein